MKAIFAGQTGLEKSVLLDNLLTHVYSWKGLTSGDPKSKQFLSSFSIEHIIEQNLNIDSVMGLLETANVHYSAEMWSKAFDHVLREIERGDPEHIFLSMHFTFHIPGRATFPYTVDNLKPLHITHVITLIDDLYEIQARIARRNAERGTDFSISLRELAWWRSQEIGMSSWLVRNLPASPRTRGGEPQPVEHYVVAAKHPVEMVRKLLFEPQIPRIYASFPITGSRDSEESRKEIDEVRATLSSIHTVFDPLTIDELSPWILSQASDGKDSVVVEKDNPRCRWPMPETGLLSSGRSDIYPIKLKAKEVMDVKGDIEHSIRMRDFGLVDACDYIVGYRPYYKGVFSKGMFAEFNHGLNVCRPPIPIHYYFPVEDQAEPGPFGQFRTLHRDKEKWLQVVRRLRASRQEFP